jgi:hypothetical protein
MKPDFSNGVPPEVLRRIRGEQDEVKGMESKSYFCPYAPEPMKIADIPSAV